MIRSIRYLALMISLLLLSACHYVGVRAGFSTGYLGGYYDTSPYWNNYYGPTIITPPPIHMGRPFPHYRPFHRHSIRPYRHDGPRSFRSRHDGSRSFRPGHRRR